MDDFTWNVNGVLCFEILKCFYWVLLPLAREDSAVQSSDLLLGLSYV